MKTSLRRNVWRFLFGFMSLFILVAILIPVIGEMRRPKRSVCQSELKNIALGFIQYTQDYNGHFPVTSLNSGRTVGWVDALAPYVKSRIVFYCDQSNVTPQDDPHQQHYTDYWMNGKLSGVNLSLIGSTAVTLLNGDGNDGVDASDARYNLKSIPPNWTSDAQSPLYRHLEGCNYSFADGHVRWFSAKKGPGSPGNTTARFGLK